MPLVVLINRSLVGRLEKSANGAISFQYGEDWLAAYGAFRPKVDTAFLGASQRNPIYRYVT